MAETLRAVTIDQISDKELASHIISNTGLFPVGFVAVFISSIGEIYSSHAAITVSNSNVSSTVRVSATCSGQHLQELSICLNLSQRENCSTF